MHINKSGGGTLCVNYLKYTCTYTCMYSQIPTETFRVCTMVHVVTGTIFPRNLATDKIIITLKMSLYFMTNHSNKCRL